MTDEPNPGRCEPPPELRGVDGWHVVSGMGCAQIAYWRADDAKWEHPNWDKGHGAAEMAAQYGWRYRAPVTPLAEVERLRVEVERWKEDAARSHAALCELASELGEDAIEIIENFIPTWRADEAAAAALGDTP